METTVGFSVYGNCQAAALRKILLQSPAFKARYESVDLAPCHTISKASLIDWALEGASGLGLFVHQKLRKGWRGDQAFDPDWMLRQMPAGIPRFVWSDMYYRAYEPYMVYPRTFGRLPLSGYINLLHVLAFVHGRPWRELFAFYADPSAVPAAAIAAMHDASHRELARREADCSIRIADFVAGNWRRSRLFFTFNHPARPVMRHAVNGILAALGINEPLPEAGWHPFKLNAAQPLLAAVEDLLEQRSPRALAESFTLNEAFTTAESYFGRWEAAFADVGREKLREELAVHVQDAEFAGPILRFAADHLGIADICNSRSS